MKRRHNALVVIGCIAMVAVLAWMWSPPPEPLYEGKPLRY